MNPTVNGVYYDLAQSPFEVVRFGARYKFSSQSHRDKFVLKVQMKEDWLRDSLSRRFKFRVDCPAIADMQLYIQIETRGFMVQDVRTGVVYDSPEQLQVIVMDFYGWSGEWQEDGLQRQGKCSESGMKSEPLTETLIG